MQINLIDRNTETSDTNRCRPPRLAIEPLGAQKPRRSQRVAVVLRRRESCMTRRAMLAAMRDAELQAWLDTGGDYLDSRLQLIRDAI